MNYNRDDSYVRDWAMSNMGEMVEYCIEACNEKPDRFFQMFQVSGIAEEWERGNIVFILGRSGTELYMDVCDRIGIKKTDWPAALIRMEEGVNYWMGRILAYVQWETEWPFQEILTYLSFDELASQYQELHNMFVEEAGRRLIDFILNKRQGSRLKIHRNRMGLSQRGLAEQSGVNVRTIQQYEIGSKDINKASVTTVLELSRALCCDIEDLLEYRND